jgi:thiamine biosynthesis lipoprotein
MVPNASVMVVVMSLGLPGPADDPARVPARFEFAETHMGSEFKIVLYSPDEATARRASRAAFDRIAELDRAFSDYNPESELMRLCDGAGGPPVKVSDDLFTILAQSRAMYERSGGAFDVTVGPVVRLWRRARRDRKMPGAENLARARALVSSALIELDPEARTVRLLKPGMKLDLGAIAKGYAADAAVRTLTGQGFRSALVAGAGDITVSGPPPGREGWTIGIAPLESPDSPPERFLSLRDASVSTSGDAERYVEIDGRRYSHIVDPRTGLGVVDRCSVTVVAPNGATADALDTAVYVLGPEGGLPLVEATEGAAAYIVRTRPEGRQTIESSRFAAIPRVRPKDSSDPAVRVHPPK